LAEVKWKMEIVSKTRGESGEIKILLKNYFIA
jgi:hypothetical protein